MPDDKFQQDARKAAEAERRIQDRIDAKDAQGEGSGGGAEPQAMLQGQRGMGRERRGPIRAPIVEGPALSGVVLRLLRGDQGRDDGDPARVAREKSEALV